MKKLVFILLILVSIISFSSCKNCKNNGELGDVDYHISGFYIEVIQDKDYKIDSLTSFFNPSVIYSHKRDVLTNNHGNIGYQVKYGVHSKQVLDEDGVKTIIFSSNIILPTSAPDEIKIYVVKENANGEFYVDTKLVETKLISSPTTYSINYSYSNNGQKIRVQGTLGISKK